MANLSNQREREALPPRRQPYWQRLTPGNFLGFRPGANTWHARHRDRDGRQHQTTFPAIRLYSEAREAAAQWCLRMRTPHGGVAKRGTVADALMSHVTYLRHLCRDKAADAVLQDYQSTVWQDPLASIQFERLTREDVEAWRGRLDNGRRQLITINQYVRMVIAGLNGAVERGWLANPAAWKLRKLQEPQADGEAAVFLTPEQRNAVIEACPPESAAFFRALELTGCRPGELAAAETKGFNATLQKLRLAHRKGRTPALKIRWVYLTGEAAELVAAQAVGRGQHEPLFRRADGRAWDRHAWATAFRLAARQVRAAGGEVPQDASAYSFRHAAISELLQLTGMDPVSVARYCGTSVAMIEKHYFRFLPDAWVERLAQDRREGVRHTYHIADPRLQVAEVGPVRA
jgi:integrase